LIILIIRNYEKASRSLNILPEFSLDVARNLTVEEAFLYEYKTITMDALSERIGLSKRQTERLLKEQYGKTFLQKRTQARMSAALILLEAGKTITQVAEIVGYSSCEHFTNAFKQFYGKSPRNYIFHPKTFL
jgi:AraC-like DNA-binding protein